jgi:hypothetical protein
MPIGYPLVSGNRFDASSIELQLNNRRYIGIQEVEYEQTLEPGVVRGIGTPQILGLTRGIHSCSGRIVMLREEFQDFTIDLQNLSIGLLEANFLGMVTYSEVPPAAIPSGLVGATSTDTIVGIRLTSTKHRFAQGSSDPIAVEMPFIARYILVNGIVPINNLLKIAVAATAG